MDSKIMIGAAVVALFIFSNLEGLSEGESVVESAKTEKIMDAKSLHGKEKQQWIEKMSSQLPIQKRKIGPFGLYQDLTVQKITKTQAKVIKGNFFPEAIAKISINVVLGKSFLIGSREIKEAEVFPLDYKGTRYKVEVVSVRANQITFKNMTTGEQVIKKMGGLPQGFERSKGFDSIPGLISDHQKISDPIKIGGEGK